MSPRPRAVSGFALAPQRVARIVRVMLASTDAMIFGLFFAVFAGVMMLIIWSARRERRRTAENLDGLASRLGLDHVTANQPWWSGEHRVEGRRDGRRVRFWTYTTGSGKSRRHWVAVGVEPRRAGGFTFRLEPQGLATRLAEWFGAKEITVGEARFDAEWFVRTNAPEVFGAALVPEIRARLTAARERGAGGDFKLEEGWVCYTEQGRFADEDAIRKLESLLPVLHDLADAAEVCADAVTVR